MDEAAVASFRLGDLRVLRGDDRAAEPAYLFALQHGDGEVAPRAGLALVGLHGEDQGRAEIVEQLLIYVIDCDHPDYSPAAAVHLARRRESSGDRSGSELYQAVRDSEHPEFADEAARMIARLVDVGADRYVEQLLERAIAVSHPDVDHDAGQLDVIPYNNTFGAVDAGWRMLNVCFDLCVNATLPTSRAQLDAAVGDILRRVSGLIDDRREHAARDEPFSVTVTVTVSPASPDAYMVSCCLPAGDVTELLIPSLMPRVTLANRCLETNLVFGRSNAAPTRNLVAHGCSPRSSDDIWEGGEGMATNPPKGDGHRNGAVRGRSQVQAPNGNWVKRDASTGRFMDQKQDGKPFKGVRHEK